jgi:branched-chain amino acid transport system substrate-binding protein
MKKIVYLSTALAFVASLSLGHGATFAAHQQASMSVRLCTSAPYNIGGDQHIVRGLWNGVEVATSQWRKKFSKLHISLGKPFELPDGKADGSAVDPAKEASNARQCLSGSADYAYIGTLNSSMAQVSEPILDRGGMAMISPANTNPVLTSPLTKDRSTYEPLYQSHALKYPTYYRVVETDALQAAVGALYLAKSLGIKNFYLVDDQQTYGAGLAAHMGAFATGKLGISEVGSGHLDTSSTAAIATSAAAVGRQVVGKNPEAIYCGCDEPYAGPMLKAARRAGFKGYFFGGDAIRDPSFSTFAGGTANTYKTYATTVGNPNSKTSAAAKFAALEKKQFPGFVPGSYDGLAYDASNIALNAIYQSAQHGSLQKGSIFKRRSSVLKYVASSHWSGTSGPISFDKNGDLKQRLLTVWTWQGSNWSLVKIFTKKNIPSNIRPSP